MRRPQRTITKSGGRVGIKLVVEVMDYSPAALTWRERWVLGVLAEDADDQTRECMPGYDGESEDSARFRARVRCSRSQYYATMKALAEKKAIEAVRRGQRQGAARFRLLPMGPAQGPGFRDAGPRFQRPANRDAEYSQGADLQDTERTQGPDLQDTEGTSQRPGLQDTDARFAPVSGSRFTGPLVGGSSSTENSSSSSPRDCARAAGVTEEEEEEFITWIHKNHKPRSGEWWRKLSANGDLTTLAEAWRATRPKPRRPVEEILTEHDAAPPAAARATYRPGEDRQLRERARQALAELPPTAWEPLLDEAGRLLLAADYDAGWNSRRVLAAELLRLRGEPITTLHLPLDPAAALSTAQFAFNHLPATDRDAAFTEAAAELREAGLTDDRAHLIHAGEILARWQHTTPTEPAREDMEL